LGNNEESLISGFLYNRGVQSIGGTATVTPSKAAGRHATCNHERNRLHRGDERSQRSAVARIAEFADALQRYDQVLVEGWREAALLRLFRRIADYDNPLQPGDLKAVYIDIDRLTVPALYCDRLGLSPNYTATLDEAVKSGRYLLTHSLLACIWIQENGCEVPMSDGFIEDVYNANAALIGDDPVVDDLELEAAAFLYLAGQGALVDHAFVERVIAVQNYDGGWLPSSDTPGESHWHATLLGLLLLLHVEYASDSYPPMLAPPSP
jgi:hypothetical protein